MNKRSVCKTVMPPYCHFDTRNGTVDNDIKKDGKMFCAKFNEPRLTLCQVIIRTRFGLPTDGRTDMSKAIYPLFVEGVPNLASLSKFFVKLSSGQSLRFYLYMSKVTVTLTFDGSVSKSIGIIYTLR